MDAIRALSEGFAEKLEKLQRQLSEKDVTVSNIARYFEDVVAGPDREVASRSEDEVAQFRLVHGAGRVATSRSSSACAGAGSASSTSAASSGTTTRWATPSATGSSRGSRGFSPIRSDRTTSWRSERGAEARDLHARFGGDEFCFLIPDLPGCEQAMEIAGRFKAAVEQHDWSREDRRLGQRPVQVDVGVVCLRLGRGAGASRRRAEARRRAHPARRRADVRRQGPQVHARPLHGGGAANGQLVDIPVNARASGEGVARLRKMGWMTGLEPAASGATVRCSTFELHPPWSVIENGRTQQV